MIQVFSYTVDIQVGRNFREKDSKETLLLVTPGVKGPPCIYTKD